MVEDLVAFRAGTPLDYSLLRPFSGDMVPLLEALSNLPSNWRSPAVFILCTTAERFETLFSKYIDFVTQARPFSKNIYFT